MQVESFIHMKNSKCNSLIRSIFIAFDLLRYFSPSKFFGDNVTKQGKSTLIQVNSSDKFLSMIFDCFCLFRLYLFQDVPRQKPSRARITKIQLGTLETRPYPHLKPSRIPLTNNFRDQGNVNFDYLSLHKFSTDTSVKSMPKMLRGRGQKAMYKVESIWMYENVNFLTLFGFIA